MHHVRAHIPTGTAAQYRVIPCRRRLADSDFASNFGIAQPHSFGVIQRLVTIPHWRQVGFGPLFRFAIGLILDSSEDTMPETHNKFHNDLTSGSVTERLLKFCLPFLGAMLFQALYNVADMVIVGWFEGSIGISGVGIGGQVAILITNLIIGLANGGTVLIAQYSGAKLFDEQKKTIGTLFSLYGLFALVLTAVLLPLVPSILSLLKTPAESYAIARDYLYICISGTVFIFGYNAVSAVLRGMGNSKAPMVFVGIAASTNVVLDILFVGPVGMGAAGAALATVLSQLLSLVLSIIYLARKGFIFDFKPKSFKIHRDKVKLLVKLGLPTGLQNLCVSFSFLILTSLANSLSVFSSAAFNIGLKVNSFAILPGIAMSQSIASMCGQNIGARLYDRAMHTMKVGMRINLLITAVVGAFVALFPDVIMGIFNADAQTVAEGADFLRCLAADALISSVVFSFNGLFLGGGHSIATLFNAALTSIILRAPLAYFFVNVLGLKLLGIGLGVTIAPVGGIIFGLIFIKTGRWKINRAEKTLAELEPLLEGNT
jgi:putative MATE family efflux protein